MRKALLPQLSIGERDSRWRQLRREMDRMGLDCLFVWGNNRAWGAGLANVRYITHEACREAIALFPAKGDPVCFAGNPLYRVPYNIFTASQGWVNDVRPTKKCAFHLVDAGLEPAPTKAAGGQRQMRCRATKAQSANQSLDLGAY